MHAARRSGPAPLPAAQPARSRPRNASPWHATAIGVAARLSKVLRSLRASARTIAGPWGGGGVVPKWTVVDGQGRIGTSIVQHTISVLGGSMPEPECVDFL